MNKNLLVMGIIALSLTLPSFAAENSISPEKFQAMQMKKPDMPPPPSAEQIKKKEEFEKRLNLTAEQKNKAKTLHEASKKEMEPLFAQAKAKHEQIKKMRENKSTTIGEIEKVQNELKEIHKKIHEIRIKNMKEFEAILTEKQAKELEKMKKEGRENFEKMKKQNPPPFKQHYED